MCSRSQPVCTADCVPGAVRLRFDRPTDDFFLAPAKARTLAYLLERYALAAEAARWRPTRAPLPAPAHAARDLTQAELLGDD